jgi:hypothetical protein
MASRAASAHDNCPPARAGPVPHARLYIVRRAANLSAARRVSGV